MQRQYVIFAITKNLKFSPSPIIRGGWKLPHRVNRVLWMARKKYWKYFGLCTCQDAKFLHREQVFFKIAFGSIVRVASWFSMMLCIKLNKKEEFVFCTITEKFKEKLYFSWFFAPIISLHYSCDLRFYTQ